MENVSSDESLINDLEAQIQSKFHVVNLTSQSSNSQSLVICSIDPLLRQDNPNAYRPNFFIIGPHRCYDSVLENIELHKRLYLVSFLRRAERKATLTDFCKLITDSADQIHASYQETYARTWDFRSHQIKQSSRQSKGRSAMFMETILVDACFVIELFLRDYNRLQESRQESDFIFDDPRKMYHCRRDLLLAHNQLPFFVLKTVYELAFAGNPDYPSFLHLTCHFFSHYFNQNKSIQEITTHTHSHREYRSKLETATHFTDLLRTLQLPYSFQIHHCGKEESSWFKWIKRRAAHLITCLFPSLLSQTTQDVDLQEAAGKQQGEHLYSAILLREAGVKFRVSSSKCLLDIEFNQKNGELKIPALRIDEMSEVFFRNLMGWEQRYYPHEAHICDYIFLMKYLIESTEDVDLLVRRRIIINHLGSHTVIVTLFDNLCKHITSLEKNRYSDIFMKLNAYNSVRRHSWIAILRLQYFSTLWRGVATVAAVILLLLTLIQTICSLISLGK